MYSPGTGDRTKQNADTRVTYKTKMITHLRNPLQGCQLDDSSPRVERCAFNPGLCDDTLSEGIQNETGDRTERQPCTERWPKFKNHRSTQILITGEQMM